SFAIPGQKASFFLHSCVGKLATIQQAYMPTWRDDKILELANQLTYSPADKRREQLNSIIDLARAIEAPKSYPWDFIHFRITSFQPRGHSDHVIPGKVLL